METLKVNHDPLRRLPMPCYAVGKFPGAHRRAQGCPLAKPWFLEVR